MTSDTLPPALAVHRGPVFRVPAHPGHSSAIRFGQRWCISIRQAQQMTRWRQRDGQVRRHRRYHYERNTRDSGVTSARGGIPTPTMAAFL